MSTTVVASPEPDEPGEARILRLPTTPPPRDEPVGGEVEPVGDILDGELLSPDEEAELDARRWAGQVAIRRATQVVRAGAAHPHAQAAGRAAGRAAVAVWQGHTSWARRAGDALTHAHVREQIQSARAGGDKQALAEWTDRLTQLKHARAERLRNLPATLVAAFKVVCVALIALAGVLVLLGAAFQATGTGGGWDGWWHLLAQFAEVIGVLAAIAVRVAPWAAIPAAVWAAYREGVRRGTVPAWLAADSEDESARRDLIPDEGAIVNALRNLNLPALNQKFKEGWRPRWIQHPVHDGRGWHAQLLLPEAVPVSAIVDRTEVLAHNLMREKAEVWPTQPRGKASVLDLYVLDPGSLTKPVDPWPLLHEGTADYFKGVPVGVNAQGKSVRGRLFEANWGVAGTMGSGKSTLIINALLGAMLDPLVEIDVYCMAFNADYDPLEPRLRTLFKSDEPEQIPRVLEALKKLMSELSERGRKLSEYGEPKLTRKIAEADPDMRPRVVVIDECQELFVSDVGEEAAELVEKMVAKARKYGVTLLFATPVPSADSLPRKVAKVLSNRACFAIGDHQGNDAILGTGKHKAGITATTLRPMTEDADGTVDPGDVGTAMTVGFMPIDGLMRCYYVRRGSGVDEVTPVVRRALELREGTGITTGPVPAIEPDREVDTLADVAAVLAGRTLVPQPEVLGLLAQHNPAIYTGWTGVDLRKALPDEARPYKTVNGTMHVNADRVRAALAARATDPEADTDGDESADDG